MTETPPEDPPVLVGWLTIPEVREAWEDAPLDDHQLARLMNAAHIQVVAFAPLLEDQTNPPDNYLLGELLQVQALGSAARRDGSDVLGFGDGFAVRARPLSAEVKSLLRPRTGPVVT